MAWKKFHKGRPEKLNTLFVWPMPYRLGQVPVSVSLAPVLGSKQFACIELG